MENPREPNRNQNTSAVQDRRKKADWVTNMATIFSLISWAVALAVWIVLDKAAPDHQDMFTRMYGGHGRYYWDSSLLPIAFVLLVASLCICVLAFIFNRLRKRRKTDKYRKSILVVGGITIIGIVSFLIRFGAVLF